MHLDLKTIAAACSAPLSKPNILWISCWWGSCYGMAGDPDNTAPCYAGPLLCTARGVEPLICRKLSARNATRLQLKQNLSNFPPAPCSSYRGNESLGIQGRSTNSLQPKHHFESAASHPCVDPGYEAAISGRLFGILPMQGILPLQQGINYVQLPRFLFWRRLHGNKMKSALLPSSISLRVSRLSCSNFPGRAIRPHNSA